MLPTFSAAELKELLELSHYLTVNDYEAQLFMDISKLTLTEIAGQVQALVITQGEKGSLIVEQDKQQIIPAIQPKQVVDPTGCGDAFRAGLMYGITRQLDWLTIGRLSNLLGAIKVESVGPQNHHFSIEEISDRFYQIFGYRFS
jgi:adenosine kinase